MTRNGKSRRFGRGPGRRVKVGFPVGGAAKCGARPRLAEVSGGAFAHDAVSRFLNREAFSGKDLFEEARPLLALEGGTLRVDDAVLDKPSSQKGKTELVGYFWSGKHGRAVKGRLPARQFPPLLRHATDRC
jgi:hypothetical protein